MSLIFGNAITILVFIFAGISGGNINPAVSWALALTRKISPFRCLVYSVAQVLGAIAGAGMVRIMTPSLFDAVNGGANQINPGATTKEALGVEFGCTFLLVLTVMAAVDKSRAAHEAIAPMIIGLAVTAAHFVAIPVDNCSINPARSFGVSVVSGSWNDHWIFWFGPYLGSTGAALLYGFVFAHEDDANAPPEGKDSAAGVAPVRLLDDGGAASPPPHAASSAVTTINPAYHAAPPGLAKAAFAGTAAPEASAAFSAATSDGGQEWR